MGNCVGKGSAQAKQVKAAPAAQPRTQKRAAPPIQQPTRKLRTDAKVRDVYKIGKTIGTGGFAVVKVATEKSTGTDYAVKIMNLPEIGQHVNADTESTREDIFKEIDILVGMDHDNVLMLKEYFEENGKVYLITELLHGGELLDAVLQRGSYNEQDARICFAQLLKGIDYLHSKGVVHRDLKLENLLLVSGDDISQIKIADFGLAKKALESSLETVCGTPGYVAPEVIQGTPGMVYSPAVDLWSAGVVLFILLGGYPPFFDESEPALFNLIRKGSFQYDDPVWESVSAQAKDLINKLLTVDDKRRLTALQALQHPWLADSLTHPASLSRTRQNMHKRMRPHFKAAVQTIIAQNRMANLAKNAKEGSAHGKAAYMSSPEEIERMTEPARLHSGPGTTNPTPEHEMVAANGLPDVPAVRGS